MLSVKQDTVSSEKEHNDRKASWVEAKYIKENGVERLRYYLCENTIMENYSYITNI